VRYDESAAALIRNQEDLRKRELKISSLEKENEQMKKKIADLEEDLRVRILFDSLFELFETFSQFTVVVFFWFVFYSRHFF
jgi:hypothetical protein